MSSEQESGPQKKPAQLYPHNAPEHNEAVAICYESHTRAIDEGREMGWDAKRVARIARRVYIKAMPPLVGQENIRDFIACVAHAMLLQIIEPADASRLLYAAQVAQSGAKSESRNNQK